MYFLLKMKFLNIKKHLFLDTRTGTRVYSQTDTQIDNFDTGEKSSHNFEARKQCRHLKINWQKICSSEILEELSQMTAVLRESLVFQNLFFFPNFHISENIKKFDNLYNSYIFLY